MVLIGCLDKFRRSALSLAIVISALCIIIYLIGPISTYETNDDVAYSLIFAGKLISGAPDPHVTYINYVLASFLVSLYTFFPGIQWYGIFQVASVFMSIFFINYLFALTRNSDKVWLGTLFSIVCLLPFAFYIQFTKTAFILTAVGYLGIYIISEVDQLSNRHRIFLSSVAIFFATTGFLLRKESFILATILCCFFIFSSIVKTGNSKYFFILLVLLISTSIIIHKTNYRGAWGEFTRFHYTIKPLLEKDNIRFEDNIEVFKKVGWSENDFLMFKFWAFSDSTTYNTEKAGYILNNSRKTAATRNIANMKDPLLKAMSFPAINYLYTVVLLSIALLLFYRQQGIKLFFYVVLPLSLAVLMISYQGRFPTRVSVAAASFVPFAILALSGELRSRRFLFVSGCIALTLIALPVYGQFKDIEWINTVRKTENHNLHKLGAELAETPATLVTWGHTFPFEGILPFESREYLSGANIIWFCGQNQTPIQNKMLEKQGIVDIFRALATQKTVFISMGENEFRLLQRYYYEHHKANIVVSPAFLSDSFTLFRVALNQ